MSHETFTSEDKNTDVIIIVLTVKMLSSKTKQVGVKNPLRQSLIWFQTKIVIMGQKHGKVIIGNHTTEKNR